jgi:hypothetical protein
VRRHGAGGHDGAQKDWLFFSMKQGSGRESPNSCHTRIFRLQRCADPGVVTISEALERIAW